MIVLVNRAGGWNQHGHSRKWGVSLKPACSNSSEGQTFLLGVRQPSFSKCCHSWNSFCRLIFCSLRINFCSRVNAWAMHAFASPSSKGKVHLDVSLGLHGWHCCCQMSTSFPDYPVTSAILSLRHTCVDSSSVSCESSLCFKH